MTPRFRWRRETLTRAHSDAALERHLAAKTDQGLVDPGGGCQAARAGRRAGLGEVGASAGESAHLTVDLVTHSVSRPPRAGRHLVADGVEDGQAVPREVAQPPQPKQCVPASCTPSLVSLDTSADTRGVTVKRSDWTLEEDALIRDLHARIGPRWAEMAKHLPGRPDNSIKNYWNACVCFFLCALVQ